MDGVCSRSISQVPTIWPEEDEPPSLPSSSEQDVKAMHTSDARIIVLKNTLFFIVVGF